MKEKESKLIPYSKDEKLANFKRRKVRIMKKRILALVLAAAMAASGNPIAAAAAEGNTGIEAQEEQLPVANILDVDFENEDGTDKSEMKNEYRSAWKDGTGKLSFEDNTALNRKVANFYDYAYVYPFNEEKYAKITDEVTVECLFKYNEFWWGEREIISNQGGGGIGIGVDGDGKLTFYAHVGGSYREPKANLNAGEWIHVVGVADGTSVKLYVNGKLADTVKGVGSIKYPSNGGNQNFVIGGDSDGNNGVENYANVSVCFARIYDHALKDQEILALRQKAFDGTEKKVNVGIVSSDTFAAGQTMDVNLHAGCVIPEDADRISYTLAYDPSKVTYCGRENLKDGVTIDDSTEGQLKVDVSGGIPRGEFREYTKTRLAELSFKARDVEKTEQTVLKIEDYHVYAQGEDVTSLVNSEVTDKTVTIYGKDALDLNGDGVVGAGDLALAEDLETKTAIAQEAAIYPYKHAVILTIDGGGNVWNPEEIYYAASASDIPQKTRNTEIMKKRTNTYAMELFGKEFATSYTAQSVDPAISAQNYTSILHGVPWGDLEEEYQVTNDSSGEVYFPDFGKETPNYPSVFRAAADAAPERQYAAFSEWKNIVKGIIEPDAPVSKKVSEAKKSFQDVADYIKSDAYKNTAIIYMQNDEMDHVGHSQGYYTDAYWSALGQLDGWYQTVIDALKETGEYEETLVIANADHGGSRWDHGSVYSSNTDVFIGLGGQTIDSGARLKGGSNADIPALALYGLRMEKPASMTGRVFDETAFLPQEELAKKGRDIDAVSFNCTGQSAELYLSKGKSDVRAADIVIELGDAKVKDISVTGGTVLRQKEENGKLKLTISYEEQPRILAKLVFEGETSAAVKVQEIMLGTAEGKEIYADLDNHYEATVPGTDKSGLKAMIDMAERLKASDYTADSYALLVQAVAEAKAVYEDETADELEIREKMTAISDAVLQLKLEVTGTTEYQKLLREFNSKEEELKKLQEEFEATDRLLKEKESALAQEQEKVQGLQSELDGKKAEVTALTAELETAKETLEQLEKEAGEKETEIADLKENVQKLQEDVRKAQEAVENLEASLAGAQNRAETLLAEKEKLETEKQELEGKVEAAKKEAEAAKAELEKCKAELEAAKKEMEKVQEELEKLKNPEPALPQVGSTVEVDGVQYRVTDVQKKTAEVSGVSDRTASKVKIASDVKVGDLSFKVTAIAAGAFKGCGKLKSVTIGKNVSVIGKDVFFRCAKLANITFRGKKTPKIAKRAFKGIQKTCKITVPKKMPAKQLKSLKTQMKKAGAGKKVKYKKK